MSQPASHADTNFGIRTTPFLNYAFKTNAVRIRVTIYVDGTWTYEEDTELLIKGSAKPFQHTDRNVLTKIAEPTPNPLARNL